MIKISLNMIDINLFTKKKSTLYPIIIFVVGIFVYLKTTAPDVTTGDSGELLASAYFLGINHPPGYPLYLLCAKLFSYICYLFYPLFFIAGINPSSIQDPFAFHVNFMSGIFTTCSMIVFYFIIIELIKNIYNKDSTVFNKNNEIYQTDQLEEENENHSEKLISFLNRFNNEIALFLSLCLGSINLIWSQSTNSEVYTLNLFLVSLVFWAMLKYMHKKDNRYLFLFSFLFGLSTVSHQSNLVFAPVFAFWIIYDKREKILRNNLILKMFLLFTLGLSVYFYMPIRSKAKPPLNWGNTSNMKNFVNHVLRKQYGQLVRKPSSSTILQAKRSTSNFIKQNIEIIKILYKNLTIPVSILVLLGLYELYIRKKQFLFFLLSHILFYSLVTIYITNFKLAKLSIYVNELFFIPILFLLLITNLFGIIFLISNVSFHFIKFIILLPVLLFSLNFHLNDEHNNYIIAEYTKNIFNHLKKNSRLFVMGDNTTFPLAYYHYVKGFRKDVLIIGEYGFVFQDVFKIHRVKEPIPEKFRRKIRDKIEENILLKDPSPIYYSYKADKKWPQGKTLENYGLIHKLINVDEDPKMLFYDFFSFRFDSMDNKNVYQDLMDRDMVSIFYYNLGNYLNNIGETILGSKYLLKSKFVSGTEYAKKRIHFNHATDYKKQGNYQKAIEELLKAIEVDPEYAKAHSLLGSIYSELGRNKEAIQSFQMALQSDPSNSKTWNNLGVEYNYVGNHQKAFDSFKQAIRIDPNNYQAYNNMAVKLEDFKKYNEAVQLYQKAIQLNPQYKDAYYNLGTLFLNANHLDRAEQLLKKAIEVYKEYADAYYNLGILYQKKKKYNNSIPYFRQAIKFRANFEKAHFNIGISYLWLKDYISAERFFKSAISLNSKSYISYKHLGNTYYYMNNMQKAYKAWKKALELNPKDKELQNNIRVLESKAQK